MSTFSEISIDVQNMLEAHAFDELPLEERIAIVEKKGYRRDGFVQELDEMLFAKPNGRYYKFISLRK